MSRYLNLGCGRVIFPLDRDHPPVYQAHLEPLEDIAYEPGWTNADKQPLPGVDECVDLFRFPWIRSSNVSPWNDDTFDVIWAAHILEHVPHNVRLADGLPPNMANGYFKHINELDGFFVFMYEAWRILKPGGLICIRAPFGVCYASLSDPTHTRYLTPGSFGYLSGQDDPDSAPFDYKLPCRFELAEPIAYRFMGRWQKESENLTHIGQMDAVLTYNNVVDEFRLVLRAVK